MNSKMRRRNLEGSQSRRSINRLPEEILILIISLLPLKDAVRTSILSKQWRCIWLLAPTWNLDLSEFPCRCFKEVHFELLVGQVLRFQPRPSGVEHMRLRHDGPRLDALIAMRWMENLSMQTIRRLDIDVAIPIRPPPEFFRCGSMEDLRMRSPYAVFGIPQDAQMPRLKHVCLEHVKFLGVVSLHFFFAACPALEHLELRECSVLEPLAVNAIISHRRLKVLILDDCSMFHGFGRLVMTMKDLERLEYRGQTFLWQSHSFHYLSSVKEATLELEHLHTHYMSLRIGGWAAHYGMNLCTMLEGLSNANTLVLNEMCIEYLSTIRMMIPLPIFDNLETVCLRIWPNKGHCYVVAQLVEFAPCLKHLRITVHEAYLYGVIDEHRDDLPEPPDFMRWSGTHDSLKEVHITKCGALNAPELLLIKFLLKVGAVLEQLDVSTCCSEWDPEAGGTPVSDIIESFPRANPDVQLYID